MFISAKSAGSFVRYAFSGILVGGSIKVISEATKKLLGHYSYKPKSNNYTPNNANRGPTYSNNNLTEENQSGYPRGLRPRR